MLLKAIMRIYSYLFHGLLALFLLGVSILALTGGPESLNLGMLPGSGETQDYWLFFAAVVGLLAVALAIKGVWRFLFFLWSLVVFGVLAKGYFLSSFHFRDAAEVRTATYLTVGALLAILGAWFQFRRQTARR